MTDPDKLLHFNGVDATTGGPLFPSGDAASFATRLLMRASSGIDAEHLRELQGRDTLAIKEGVDLTDLAQTGWGVVFPAARPGTAEARRQDAIAEALYPLFDLRRGQAARIDERRFKIYRGGDGYWPQETKSGYLARIGAAPGSIDPDRVPYYLMLVASPEELPFSVQVQLDVHYSVGRLHFEAVESFANYARTVLAAETAPLRPRTIALVGVANPGDPVTAASARDIIAPLATPLATALAPDWQVFHYAGEHAQKASVARLLGGDATPALLMLAGHGVGWPGADPCQQRYQGALVCQDWPGPGQPGRLNVQAHCFTADDVRPDADLAGLILVDLTCFGAGTPVLSDDGRPLASSPFLSGLHASLLGHPRGGALATIGHLERAYGAATHPDGARGHRLALDVAVRKLLAGYPVGAAMEEMNDRYATLALDLHAKLTALRSGAPIEPTELTDLWIATHDARGCSITGDPAVRIAAAPIRRVDPPTRRTVAPTLAPTPEPARDDPPPPAPAVRTEPKTETNIDIDIDEDDAPEPPPLLAPVSRTLIDTPREQVIAEPAKPRTKPEILKPEVNKPEAKPRPEAKARPVDTKPEARPSKPLDPKQVTHTVASKSPLGESGLAAILNNLLAGKRDAVALPELPSLEQLTHGLLQLLQRALVDVGDLEVRTFVSPDLAATAAAERDQLAATAELKAFSRVHLDGDIDVCVPQGGSSEADREVWQLHGEMVKQAQQNRAELLRMLLSTSAHILRGG
jgi:hypothetical protein